MNEKFKNIHKYIIKHYKNNKSEEQFDFEELAAKIPPVFTFSSIVEAMEIFKIYNCCALPVVNLENEVIGVITERDIAHLIALQSIAGWSKLKNYTVDSIPFSAPSLKDVESTLEEISAEFTNKDIEILPLIDEDEKYTGYCVTASNLIIYTSNSIKPRSIGGLATPLGVYLTDGFYKTGSGDLGLVLTGVVFSLLINFVTLLTVLISLYYKMPEFLLLLIQLFLFVVFLRLSPLAGFHAAEHQTIHAIEKGLELTIDNVKAQPKEHERCGTNIMILVLGFSLMFYISFDYLADLHWFLHTIILVVFTFVIFSTWKKIGLKIQRVFTTANASEDQLMSGIDAGNQLLEYYKSNTKPVKITPMMKLWNMGLVQILITFMIISFLIQLVITYFWPSFLVYATIKLTF